MKTTDKNQISVFLVGLFLTFLVSLSASSVFGQTKYADDFWKAQENHVQPLKKEVNQIFANGSPYLSDNYFCGKIVMKDGMTYENIPLRFNIYTNNFEFKISGHEAYEIGNLNKISEVQMNDGKFVRLPYIDDDNQQKTGFFKLLKDGSSKLLLKYCVQYIPPKKTKTYLDTFQVAEPAQFVHCQLFYFVQSDGEPAIRIQQKSDLLQALSDRREEIKGYIRRMNINVHMEADLRKVISYYNALNSSLADQSN